MEHLVWRISTLEDKLMKGGENEENFVNYFGGSGGGYFEFD